MQAACKPDFVLASVLRRTRGATICLGPRLRGASSSLPAVSRIAPGARTAPHPLEVREDSPPIWPCSGRGLPCLRHRWRSGELLPRLFTLTPRPPKSVRGGIFSAALRTDGLSAKGPDPSPLRRRTCSGCLDVIQRPVLWSPDFPHPVKGRGRATACRTIIRRRAATSYAGFFAPIAVMRM